MGSGVIRENLKYLIAGLLSHAADLRNHKITWVEYTEYRRFVAAQLRLHGVTMPSRDFLAVLDGLPGFERTHRHMGMRAQMVLGAANDARGTVDELGRQSVLPEGIWIKIFITALVAAIVMPK